jgi:putative salt-induced outer membrane protein YdiY
MRHCLLLLCCTAALCISSNADQIALQNGDRLSGTIVKSDEKELVLNTDYAGPVTIKWAAVQSLSSSAPLHVQTKDGRTLTGNVAAQDGSWVVREANGQTVPVSKGDVSLIRGEAEETAYNQAQHPGLLQNWEGGTNFGFALTRGNSESKNLALSFTADRKTLHDKLGLYANSVYATNDAPGAIPSTTANAIRGGTRYDHDLNPRLFGFGSADFATDDLQNLDLRSVLGGGLGLHAINTPSTTLDLLAGLNYTHEAYTTFTRNFPAAILGEELTHKLGASTLLSQKLGFFPDLSDLGEYRGTFDFGTVTKISKWLGWQNSVSDVYVTNPPLGKKKNDIILTTGLNISFTRPTESGK